MTRQEVDARLIESAPKLLAGIIDCIEWIGEHSLSGEIIPHLERLVREATGEEGAS